MENNIVSRSTCLSKLSLTAFLLYVLANTLVLIKYTMRVSDFGIIIGIIYSMALTCGAILILPKLLKRKSKDYNWISVSLGFIMLVLMLVVQYHFDPLLVRVDRWSGIHNCLSLLFNGDFPYYAKTHMNHSVDVFPLWLLMHIPFFLLGNADLSFFVALSLFLFSIRKVQGSQALFCAVLFIFISVEIWYEVSVYSDYITNFLLVATVVNLSIPYYSVSWVRQHWIPISIVLGLFTATRFSAFVPLAIMIFPMWIKVNWKLKIMMLIVFFASFVVTFLPFVIWDYKAVMIPVLYELSQGSSYGLLILVPLGIILSLNWKKNARRLFTYQALTIFLFAAVTFGIKLIVKHQTSIFIDGYDLAYIGSLIPFAVLALVTDRQHFKKY